MCDDNSQPLLKKVTTIVIIISAEVAHTGNITCTVKAPLLVNATFVKVITLNCKHLPLKVTCKSYSLYNGTNISHGHNFFRSPF
jgi:hypothetical protein